MMPNADSACSLCHGTGFITTPPSERYPQGASAPCPCVRRALQRRRLAALMQQSGLDRETILRWSFDSFCPAAARADEAGRRTLARTKEACQAFALNPCGWLVLSGPCGSGKSHLAYAIAGARLRARRPVYIASVPVLLQALRDGYNASSLPTPSEPGRPPSLPFSQRLAAVRDAELLILDDLGAENSTPWTTDVLFQIIDYRHIRRLPLVVTTNVNLYDPRGAIDQRIVSRLLDGANLPDGFTRLHLLRAKDYRQRTTTA